MRVVSINVGCPGEISIDGRLVKSAIFKRPIDGPVRVTALNLEGDAQADLTAHGGPDKAVYIYPAEHYVYWRRELPGLDLEWGSFGENIDSEGLLENRLNVGDRLCVGSVELKITEPRIPCFKLAGRLGRKDIVKRFLKSRRTGFYCAVTREGMMTKGDRIEIVSRDPQGISVAELAELYASKRHAPDALRRALAAPGLPASWRRYLARRLGD